MNTSVVLIAACGASYVTTFVRERYFYQHAYGTHTLDRLEVALSVAAIASNLAGVVLALWWSAGRITSRRMAVIGVFSAAVAGALATRVPEVGLLLAILVASSAFLWGAQRAATAGRQLIALLGAISAPAFTLATWHWIGIDRPSSILLGYLAGGAWQALVAIMAGKGAPSRASPTPGGPSLLWPVVYMLAVQVDAVMDQAVLLTAGRGWAGAGSLAFNLLIAAVAIVVGPLGAQALAGRLDLGRWRDIVPLTAGITVVYLAVVIVALPFLIQGGDVAGEGYHRIFVFAILYGFALPFAIVWNLRTRVAQKDSSLWRAMSKQAMFIFGVHLVALAVIASQKAWELIPLATVLGFALGSASLARSEGADRRRRTAMDGRDTRSHG